MPLVFEIKLQLSERLLSSGELSATITVLYVLPEENKWMEPHLWLSLPLLSELLHNGDILRAK